MKILKRFQDVEKVPFIHNFKSGSFVRTMATEEKSGRKQLDILQMKYLDFI